MAGPERGSHENPAAPMTTQPTSNFADGAGEMSRDDRNHRELMALIQGGDMRAFERLYLAFHPRLSRFCLRTVRRADLVDDLVNETMLVVWEKPGSFDYTSKVSTWIFGIAYRKALKAAAKQARRAGDLPIDEFEDVLADGKATPARQVEADDFIAAALDALSPEQRAVVELTYCQGLPYQDIAEILGCPENTVKTRMFHARKKLQGRFGDLAPAPRIR